MVKFYGFFFFFLCVNESSGNSEVTDFITVIQTEEFTSPSRKDQVFSQPKSVKKKHQPDLELGIRYLTVVLIKQYGLFVLSINVVLSTTGIAL